MKIAAYVNVKNEVASFQDSGCVRLFEKRAGNWTPCGEIPFLLDPGLSLGEIQEAVTDMAGQLHDCTVFLSGDLRGLPYAILQDGFGIHAWKSSGSLTEQLDAVALKEAERRVLDALSSCGTKDAETSCASKGCACPGARRGVAADVPVSVVRVGPRHLQIDLIAALQHDPDANSRRVLMPVLQQSAFDTLEILCDHIPRWFESTLDDLNLTAQSDRLPEPGSALRVTVTPRQGRESQS